MPRGGKRPGAGRPKGSRNKLTKELRERLKGVNAIPELVLVDIMRESKDEKLRLDAAKALMPYLWPKLSSVDVDVGSGDEDGLPVIVVKRRDDGKQ